MLALFLSFLKCTQNQDHSKGHCQLHWAGNTNLLSSTAALFRTFSISFITSLFSGLFSVNLVDRDFWVMPFSSLTTMSLNLLAFSVNRRVKYIVLIKGCFSSIINNCSFPTCHCWNGCMHFFVPLAINSFVNTYVPSLLADPVIMEAVIKPDSWDVSGCICSLFFLPACSALRSDKPLMDFSAEISCTNMSQWCGTVGSGFSSSESHSLSYCC